VLVGYRLDRVGERDRAQRLPEQGRLAEQRTDI
jgi:hypothetical protein